MALFVHSGFTIVLAFLGLTIAVRTAVELYLLIVLSLLCRRLGLLPPRGQLLGLRNGRLPRRVWLVHLASVQRSVI